MAVVRGALIGGGGAGILAGLDHLGGDGGADAGGEDGVGPGLPEHHGLDVGEGSLELPDGGDLLADVGIDTGQIVSGAGHGEGSVSAQLGDKLVDVGLGLGEHLVRAAEYAFK